MSLVRNGKITREAVVIPGHALDFLAGSHIPILDDKQTLSVEEFKDFIVSCHYVISKKADISRAIEKWMPFKHEKEISKKSFIQEYLFWEWKNRQAKFIANDVRAYEFAGLKWEMPFWDRQVAEFWSGVPLELLEKRRLQYLYMKKVIDPLAKISLSYPLDDEEKSGAINIIKAFVKKKLPISNIIFAYIIALQNHKKNDMAFYDHIPNVKYMSYILKYGSGFALNTLEAQDYIDYVYHTY